MNTALIEASIARLVAAFYGKARRDPLIGPVFEAAVDDWDQHLARLEAFWSSVMLTSGRYKGNPFAAHMPLGLTSTMFTRWLELWRETTAEIFDQDVAAEFVVKAERIASSLSLGLFERPLERHPCARPAVMLEMISDDC